LGDAPGNTTYDDSGARLGLKGEVAESEHRRGTVGSLVRHNVAGGRVEPQPKTKGRDS